MFPRSHGLARQKPGIQRFPHDWQGLKYVDYHLLPAKHRSRKLDWKQNQDTNQVLPYGTQALTTVASPLCQSLVPSPLKESPALSSLLDPVPSLHRLPPRDYSAAL